MLPEITKDEDTGKTVIRAKSVASYRSSNKGESSRRSSRQSIIIDVPTGEVIGRSHGRSHDQEVIIITYLHILFGIIVDVF